MEPMAVADTTQDEKNSWFIGIEADVWKSTAPSSSWSICKVPSMLRDTKNAAYSPQIISIGPLHHGTDNVLDMEEHKSYYTKSLFKRTFDEKRTLEDCGELLRNLDEKVRSYYARVPREVDLAKILLFHGCFIVELFLRFYYKDHQDDPIFKISWMLPILQSDLALLENQIPFLVLEKLFAYIVCHTDTSIPTLLVLALHFFYSFLNTKEGIDRNSERDISHFLDLIHRSYLPSSPRAERFAGSPKLSCATELRRAGIDFQDVTDQKNLLDLKFEKGVFKIPQVVVDDSTDSLFRNLIAFEQCTKFPGHYVTSYALLMDRLVNTISDVELLEQKNIIQII